MTPVDDQKPAIHAADTLEFGRFRVELQRRVLLADGRVVPISSRALDVLVMLLQKPGVVLSKGEIIGEVWRGTFVDESNLRVQIAALRKAFGETNKGERYILNVPNRGYSFVAPVIRHAGASIPIGTAFPAYPAHNVPALLTRIIGRDGLTASLFDHILQRRLVTVVGPGGIGKTTVAQAVATRLLPEFAQAIYFLDLAALFDSEAILSRLAQILGITPLANNKMAEVIAVLQQRPVLLVLDNCEHVIEIIAEMVEDVLRGAPMAKVLATSREPLRAEGEYTIYLNPLEFPIEPQPIGLTELMAYASIELFVERATGTFDVTSLTADEAAALCEICRRLDGIPLAIELAARRADIFGLRELANKLDDCFSLLTRGRRTALPRHQTLRATLDWSHDLLSPREQIVLRRLSIFNGRFSIDAAQAVIACDSLTTADIRDDIDGIVAKSMLVPERGLADANYRMLDTTLTYARAKLVQSDEADAVSRHHALYYQRMFEDVEAEWKDGPTEDWMINHETKLANLRAALNWAASENGDTGIFIALTVAGGPMWMMFSLSAECQKWAEAALAMIVSGAAAEPSQRMRLYAGLGWALTFVTGNGAKRCAAAWRTVLDFAKQLDDVDFQLRALHALWTNAHNQNAFGSAGDCSALFQATAVDSNDRLIGTRLLGTMQHYLGDQGAARKNIDEMLAGYTGPLARTDIVRFRFDQEAIARIALARVLWLQGFTDQAAKEVDLAIAKAERIDHLYTLLAVLVHAACPLALLSGDLLAADRFQEKLSTHAGRHGLNMWNTYAGFFRGQLLIRRGQSAEGSLLLEKANTDLRYSGFAGYLPLFFGIFAKYYPTTREPGAALVAVDDAIDRCMQSGRRWEFAELLRIRAKVLLQEDAIGNADEAESIFQDSLRIAQEQGALSWQLRTANSLATHWHETNRAKAAYTLLAPIYARFTEGFGTEDMRKAATLLSQLTNDMSCSTQR